MRLYDLTELGDTWTWKHRVLEVTMQSLGLLLVRPLVALHRAADWALSKLTP